MKKAMNKKQLRVATLCLFFHSADATGPYEHVPENAGMAMYQMEPHSESMAM